MAAGAAVVTSPDQSPRVKPPRPQALVVGLLDQIVEADVAVETAPAWLMRPGRNECLGHWELLQTIYRGLTGLELPESMPVRESRRVDAVLKYPDGRRQIVEIDERQHFTGPRAVTLSHYPDDIAYGFPLSEWVALAEGRTRREPGGGFARPCPPLFPEPGGRHAQRAFRDVLADLVPPEHGWLPTVRVNEYEIKRWGASSAHASLAAVLGERGVPAPFLRAR